MSKSPKKFSANEKRLITRYLVWCYKTTKEDLDRIDRYFTQLEVDKFVLGEISKVKSIESSEIQKSYQKLVHDFREYMKKKEENVLKEKFGDLTRKEPKAEYLYLRNRLSAIEKAICHFLGEKELKNIQQLYEDEMTERILKAREHT